MARTLRVEEQPIAQRAGPPLGILLRRCRLALTELEARAEADLRRFAVLSVLAMGPFSQQRLSEYLSVNPSVMVGLIDELEANGSVERRRSESDRRSYALLFTDAGEGHAAELAARLGRVSTTLLCPLGRRRTKQLVALLRRLVEPHFEPPLPQALASSPAFLLAAAAERLEETCDALLRPQEASVRTFVALAVLGGRACSQASLATTLFLSPAATVDLVDALERRGLVRRGRPASDRRAYRLELTASGEALLERCGPLIAAATAAYTTPLGPDELAELRRLLAEVDGHLRKPS